MTVTFSSYTEAGGRPQNEDSVMTRDDGNTLLAMVADGLGGHAAGEVASRLAVSTIAACLQGQAVTSSGVDAAVMAAHQAILDKQRQDHVDMKTTIAALWIEDGVARGVHVGDSRIYQFRDGKVIYQSLDHSQCQLEVLMGHMTQEQIRSSTIQNILLRALGGAGHVKPDIAILDIQLGDLLLLCTDGFWELILEQEMIRCACGASSAKEWLERMRTIVTERQSPESDNHTAATIMIGQENGGNGHA